MKRHLWIRVICMVISSLLILAACSNQSGDINLSSPLSSPQESVQTSSDDFGDILKTNWNSYLISAGADCAQMTIDALLNDNSPYDISEQTMNVLQNQERYQILVVPLTDDTVSDIINCMLGDSQDAAEYDDILQRILGYYSKSNYLNILNNDSYGNHYNGNHDYSSIEYQEAARFYSFDRTWTMAAPPINMEDQIMFFTIGSRVNPQAGVFLTFENVDNGIMTIKSGMLWAGLFEDLLENFPNWFNTDNWYSQEEINAAKQEVADVPREISPESVGDVNQFLIETAAQLNTRFEEIMLDESEDLHNVGFFYENSALFDAMLSDCKSFDLAAVITSEGSRDFPGGYDTYFVKDVGYELMEVSLLSAFGPKLYLPLPAEWTSDVTVLLGSANARYFAMVNFRNLANVQSQGSSGMLAAYKIAALQEGQSFTDIQSFLAGWVEKSDIDNKLTYASPYGTWDEYEGFKNFYTEY